MPRSSRLLLPAIRHRGHECCWGNSQPTLCIIWGRDSGRAVASRRNARQAAFAVRSKSEAGQNVLTGEVWKVFQDLVFSHPGCQVVQHIVHRDPHTPDARLSAHLVALNRNDLAVIHGNSSETLFNISKNW